MSITVNTSFHNVPTSVIQSEHLEEEAKIARTEFYKTTKAKLIQFYLLSIFTIGLLPLICFWKPSARALFKYVSAQPSDAEYALIENIGNIFDKSFFKAIDGTIEHVKVHLRDYYFSSKKRIYKSFVYRLYLYFFDEVDGLYKPCEFSLQGKTYNDIHRELGNGMPSTEVYKQRLVTFGPNSTDVPIKSNLRIFIEQVVSPFYIFQLFAIIFWGFFGDYEIYAGFIFCLSVIILSVNFFQIKANKKNLTEKTHFQTEMQVYRPSKESRQNATQIPKPVDSLYLVPGDLVEISAGQRLPCDIILLSGTCVVDESMLTGESTHLIKKPLPKCDREFDFWSDRQYILLSGTECIETIRSSLEPQILGVVVKTGFWTVRARLIRSFYYLRPTNHEFSKDCCKFLAIIASIGLICFIYIVIVIAGRERDAGKVTSEAINVITIIIPPALPTLVSIGMFIASLRLKSGGITTKSELKINTAAKVRLACFDRIGTLTETSLSLYGVKPVIKTEENIAQFQSIIKSDIPTTLSSSNKETCSGQLLLGVMATCHNLQKVEDVLKGDNFDLKMFEATEWHYNCNHKKKTRLYGIKPSEDYRANREGYSLSDCEISVIKRFECNSKDKRLSVIVKSPEEEMGRLNVKGSPETVKKLCDINTIPEDFDDILAQYIQTGYKVIACATKILKENVKVSDNPCREFFEKDLEFLGFLVFENKIKQAGPLIINQLSQAGISSLMFTGDAPITAIPAARKCGILTKQTKIVLGTLDEKSSKKIIWSWIDFRLKDENLTEEGNFEEKIEMPGSQTALEEFSTDRNGSLQDLDISVSPSLLERLKNDDNIALALTGDAFRYISQQKKELLFYQTILHKTKIFARVNAEDKVFIIKAFQKQGEVVAMCADGVNNYPALGAADVSVALSESEASFAASFTSKLSNITCLGTIIREGRSTIVTVFQCFKYMVLYSLIQTFSVALLCSVSDGISNAGFLYQDLIIVMPLVLTMLLSKPTEKISKEQPSSSLISITEMISVFGQYIIHIGTQIVAVFILRAQEWYFSPKHHNKISIDNGHFVDFDSTTLFLVTNMQFIVIMIVFSVGKRHFRQPFYKNWPFIIALVLATILNLVLILIPIPALNKILELRDFKPMQSFRWIILAIVVINGLVALLYERFILYMHSFLSSKMTKKRTYVTS